MANLVDVIADAEKQVSTLLNKHIRITKEILTGANAKIDASTYTVWAAEHDEKVSDKFWLAEPLAVFSLTQLPGCCGICVSYHAVVYSYVRRKGLGTLLCGIRKEIARALGYGCLLCTDVADNIPQQRILNKQGWKDVHEFINPRTDNEVKIHVVNL